MTEPLAKTCTHCGVAKLLTEFYKGHGRFGRESWCRTCSSEAAIERQARQRAAMGDDAWLASRREIVARSRQRRGSKREREYARAKGRAIQTLIDRHRDELEHLLTVELALGEPEEVA